MTAAREAVVRLIVQGTGSSNREINATLDTGFNGYLALPARLIEALGLQGLGREQVTLASGEVRLTRKYEASVRLAGMAHPVEVVEAGEALVGMALLWGSNLCIRCAARRLLLPFGQGVEGGAVRIDEGPLEA